MLIMAIQMFSSCETLFILNSFLCPKFMCNKRKLYDTFSKVSEESKILTNAMSSKRKTKQHQSESKSLVLLKGKSERLSEPTGGLTGCWCSYEGARPCPLKK